MSWLLEVQDDGGCWNGENIRDTAFVLASVWPDYSSKNPIIDTPETESCIDKDSFCVGIGECGGSLLSDYTCNAFRECCDKKPEEKQGCRAISIYVDDHILLA